MNTDKHTVTFVSAYLKVYKDEYESWRGFDGRLEYFRKMLELGVFLCVYIESEYVTIFSELENTYPNLKVMEYLSMKDLPITQQTSNMSLALPIFRNELKDTSNYMCMILSKSVFVKRVIEMNPFKTEYVCWIDFSLPYVFKNMEKSLRKLNTISTYPFTEKKMYIPGCWSASENLHTDIEKLITRVVWRFCGGILFGDNKSVMEFCEAHEKHLLSFLKEYETLVWEVNYWAWLELKGYIRPTWCKADHNDSILDIPMA